MVIGSPQQRNVMEPLSFEEAWEYALATFSEGAELAGERDVMLCMERCRAIRRTSSTQTKQSRW